MLYAFSFNTNTPSLSFAIFVTNAFRRALLFGSFLSFGFKIPNNSLAPTLRVEMISRTSFSVRMLGLDSSPGKEGAGDCCLDEGGGGGNARGQSRGWGL